MSLVSATLPMLRAEVAHPEEFARLLGADVASPWPPPLNDAQSNQWMIRYLEEGKDAGGWSMFYYLLREGPNNRPIAIGNGGYKGGPSPDGTVEIGYSIVEAYQGKGLGTEAAYAMIDHAFRDRAVTRVIAETFPHLIPSIRILEKNGFARIEGGSEPGVIRLELRREVFAARAHPRGAASP
jgi:RimJ/RimL family protein N-acetyltransferase